jgi:hypothetical protein
LFLLLKVEVKVAPMFNQAPHKEGACRSGEMAAFWQQMEVSG